MKNLLFSNIKNFRYERKFHVEGVKRDEVEAILRLHPAVFREIYHKRTVNNIYLDAFNLQHYFDNINGVNRRLKVRVRWYGKLFGFIEKSSLELKLKHNLHVGKLQYPLESFTLDENFSIDVMREIFKRAFLHEAPRIHLAELNFSLFNSYIRRYFLSLDHKYRITVDDGITVYKLRPYCNNFLHKVTDHTGIVLEVKYNKPDDEFVDDITNRFPFRMTRSSKYVMGIEKLNS